MSVNKILVIAGFLQFFIGCAHADPMDNANRRFSRAHAGLLSGIELDLMATKLEQDGTRTYRIYTEQQNATFKVESRRGLLLLRSPEYLERISGNFYTDNRGNLLFFGPYQSPGEFYYSSSDYYGYGVPTYAVTLFSGGGHQIVVDTDGDGVIDIGVSESIKDQFGFLATPGMHGALDCLRQQLAAATGTGRALDLCLSHDNGGGNGNNAGGGNPGVEGPGSSLEPDCGSNGRLPAPGFSSPGGSSVAGGLAGQIFEQLRHPPKANYKDEIDPADPRDTNSDGHYSRLEQDLWRADKREARRRRPESGNTLAPELARERKKEFNERMGWKDTDGDGVPDASVPSTENNGNASTGPTQPAPGPNGARPPSGSDPRCQEPSTWNRLATEECANNLFDCLKRMQDPLYAKTDGRCAAERGPNDAATVQCDDDKSFSECVAGGGSPQDCFDSLTSDGGGMTLGGENDDIFNNDQGSLDVGLLDVHPFGAMLAAMCQSGGGIGFCGDPVPTMDEM